MTGTHFLPASRRVVLLGAIFAFVFLLIPRLHAQVVVELSIKRTFYIAYEPLLATVRITNLSGNPLLLADVEGKKWFGFQITASEGRPIAPMDPNYEVQPVKIGAGESISRTVNLIQLYPLGDFGSYHVRAMIYVPELSTYFSSEPRTIEISEGRLIWEQIVGVPEKAGIQSSLRTISLLSQRLTNRTDLYLRIQDKQNGIVYCTHRLGDYITFGKPEIMLDSTNTIHVLQNTLPKEFVYSKVGLDGKILERASYNTVGINQPHLHHLGDGNVVVAGGVPFDPHAQPTPVSIPKLSDRPVALPTPESSPTPDHSGNPTPTPKAKLSKKKTPSSSPTPVKID